MISVGEINYEKNEKSLNKWIEHVFFDMSENERRQEPFYLPQYE